MCPRAIVIPLLPTDEIIRAQVFHVRIEEEITANIRNKQQESSEEIKNWIITEHFAHRFQIKLLPNE